MQGVPSNGSKNSCFINFAKKATQALADAQVCQRWVIAGSHVDLDGVGHVQGVPSNGTNNSYLVNFAGEVKPSYYISTDLTPFHTTVPLSLSF